MLCILALTLRDCFPAFFAKIVEPNGAFGDGIKYVMTQMKHKVTNNPASALFRRVLFCAYAEFESNRGLCCCAANMMTIDYASKLSERGCWLLVAAYCTKLIKHLVIIIKQSSSNITQQIQDSLSNMLNIN